MAPRNAPAHLGPRHPSFFTSLQVPSERRLGSSGQGMPSLGHRDKKCFMLKELSKGRRAELPDTGRRCLDNLWHRFKHEMASCWNKFEVAKLIQRTKDNDHTTFSPRSASMGLSLRLSSKNARRKSTATMTTHGSALHLLKFTLQILDAREFVSKG